MNLVVAIFLYLGLVNSKDAVITDTDIVMHQEEISRTQNDPKFYQFVEDQLCRDGIFVMDLDANE